MSTHLHAPMPPQSPSDATASETVWDPFSGTLPFEQTPVAAPTDGLSLPGWLSVRRQRP